MVIYNIHDFAPLFAVLDRCPDGAAITLQDGRQYDWQTNRAFLRALLGSLDCADCPRLEVRARGEAGTGLLFRYLMSKDRAPVLSAS